jgi:hypothetical protein
MLIVFSHEKIFLLFCRLIIAAPGAFYFVQITTMVEPRSKDITINNVSAILEAFCRLCQRGMFLDETNRF